MVNSLNEVEIIDVVGTSSSFGAIVNNNGKQEIYVWGRNHYGQLGLGDKNNRLVPTLLDSSKLGNYKSVKEFRITTEFVTTIIVDTNDGEKIYVCGTGQNGVLGLGDSDDRLSPTLFDTTIFGEYALIKEIYFGLSFDMSHAIIIDNIGKEKIYVWGNNYKGGLGVGETIGAQRKPMLFDTTKFGSYVSIKELEFGYSSYAILERSDGKNELYTWGKNDYGQLGLGSSTSIIYIPTKVSITSGKNIKFIKLSYYLYGGFDAMFVVITNNGIDELYTCGYGNDGKLAQGTSPNNITTLTRVSQSLLNNATEIMMINGNETIFASVKINGVMRLISWGRNERNESLVGSGIVWNPTLIDNSKFGNFTEIYNSVFTDNMEKYWDNSACYAYVKTSSGDKLYTWKYNDRGQLGIGNNDTYITSPVEVKGLDLSTAKITKFPDNFSYSNILKLERNNQIEYFGAGRNDCGQLARNNTTDLSTFTKILPAIGNTNPISRSTASKLTTAEVLNLINPKNTINTKELEKYVDTTSFPVDSTLSIDMAKTTTNLEQGILNLAINTDKYNSMLFGAITTPKTFEIVIDGLWKATNIDSKPIMVKAELFPDEVQKTIEQLYNTICDETGKVIDRPLLEQYLDLTSIPPTAELHLSYSSSGYDKQGTFSIETNEVYLNGITTPQVYATTDLMITLGAFPLNLGLIIPLALVGAILLIITIATFTYLNKKKKNTLFI